jgi:hypothetical protein
MGTKKYNQIEKHQFSRSSLVAKEGLEESESSPLFLNQGWARQGSS